MKQRWALLGLGRIAERFFKVASQIQEIEIVAVASSDKQRAVEWAKQHNVQEAYCYEELYTASVDAVYVASNNHLHYTNVINLLKNKKAVLCEKPLALNSSQAAEMIATAKENDVLLMEAMWTKFLPCSIAVREIVKSQKYGKITSFEGCFMTSMLNEPTHRIFDKGVGGGALLDLGVYPISYIYAIMGMPNGIKAVAEMKNGVDMTTCVELQYQDLTAIAKCSCVSKKRDNHIFIDMEKASIEVYEFNGAKEYVLIKGGKKSVEKFEDKDGFYYEVAHFVDLLRQDKKQSDIQTLLDSQNVMDIMTHACKIIDLEY